MPSNERHIGYARVSTAQQDLRRQLRILNSRVNTAYRDHGLSGAIATRPRYLALLTDIHTHPRHTYHIYVTEQSRLIRDFFDFVSEWCYLIRQGRVVLHIISRDLILSADSPDHVWETCLIQAWADQKFLSRVADSTRAGIAASRAAGTQWGRKLDTTHDDTIIRLFKQNESQSAIARATGVSRTKVRTTLIRHGLLD